MDRRRIAIIVFVCVGALIGVGAYWWLRPVFEVYSTRIVDEIQGMPGPDGFPSRWTNPRPGEAQIVIVTVKVNRGGSSDISTADFALRFSANASEQTVRCNGVCPVDDPEHPGGLWMLTNQNEEVRMQGGPQSKYLHLAFLVPIAVKEGAMLFKNDSIGAVRMQR